MEMLFVCVNILVVLTTLSWVLSRAGDAVRRLARVPQP
jgi:hypothetical protein